MAIKALLAVTICFPFRIDVSTKSLARSHPPINSINTSTSGLLATSIKSVVTLRSKDTADFPLRAPTWITSIFTPPLFSTISGELLKFSRTAPPTFPTPHTPTLIDFII